MEKSRNNNNASMKNKGEIYSASSKKQTNASYYLFMFTKYPFFV